MSLDITPLKRLFVCLFTYAAEEVLPPLLLCFLPPPHDGIWPRRARRELELGLLNGRRLRLAL